jgi:peptide/nickel transport system permease protein
MAVAEPYITRRTLRGNVLTRRPAAFARVTLGDRIALAMFVLVTVLAIVGPWFAPYKPNALASTSALPIPPFHHGFLLGTDDVGHDIFSRVLYGIRITWLASLEVIASGVLIGGFIGVVAGTAGGWVDNALMRFTDIFLALPAPLLAIAVVAALGPSLQHTLIAVAIVWWPFYARIVRGEIKALAARQHLEAARLSGVGGFRLATRHLLPGAIPATVVTASLDVGNLILLLSILSFLGLGAQWPSSELALNSAHGLQYILTDWWIAVMYGLGIFVLALVANFAGDGLRDLMGSR